MSAKRLLEGKRVVITGAASGIGAQVAATCAEDGACIMLLDLDAAKAAEVAASLAGEGHSSVPCNVVDAGAVAEAFRQANEKLGGVDAVVNCAGIWRPSDDGPIARVSDETWDQIIAVNLTGTFNVCREAVKSMEGRGGGSIVTVASVVALTGWEKLNAYSASKGGVLSLSRALAVECGKKGIRVNCVCPGVIETPMTEAVLVYSKPTVLPIGRLGRPSDIADSIAFLCSDRSAFTTGATVVVDGGFSAA
ncbi:SDR family NAD(P)-dependent oxidoreductase [Nitratireductor kimnyeongensis]|uniref:SDR family NAD(P)-dependent oxidoreductase n=1 Tax=Nitratireductor kimnyeongensis TaxID=430679 RepID=A0ABW0T5K6_9HYPH|nr:SDR family NAD(P)-dependent oxidoreductase [Nitratireductor kimnyeongensis]QZZ34623.1 SDR family oxidoreductase [Nitratireductor kimnyeongensis]